MKYVVVETCYFNSRYYKKGDEVEFNSASDIPAYFKAVGRSEEKKQDTDKEKTKTRTKAKGKEKNG